MRELVKNGYYRHFKGGEYQVIDIAYDSETLDEVVIYKSLKNNTLWVRKKEMFLSEVVEALMTKVTRFLDTVQFATIAVYLPFSKTLILNNGVLYTSTLTRIIRFASKPIFCLIS